MLRNKRNLFFYNDDPDKGGEPAKKEEKKADEFLEVLGKLGAQYGLQQEVKDKKEEPKPEPGEKDRPKETPKEVSISEEVVKKAMEEGDFKGLTDLLNNALSSVKPEPVKEPEVTQEKLEKSLRNSMMETLQEATFWTQNPDLALFVKENPSIGKFVNLVKDTKKADSNIKPEELYNEVGKEVRTLLGDRLKEVKTDSTRPAFPQGGNFRGQSFQENLDTKNSVRDQIKDLENRRRN